jgi:hypothetical protein
MKNALLVALLTVIAGCATAPSPHPGHGHGHGKQVPPGLIVQALMQVQPKLDPEKFETFNAAATYAIAKAYETSDVYETSGVVVMSLEHKYQVTEPVTDNSGDSVRIPAFHRPGYEIVADYHTHPCLPYTHFVKWFSPEDIEETQGKVTAIMGNLCTGEVNSWTFKVDPVGNYIGHDFDGEPVGLTTGHVIGHVIINREPKVKEKPTLDAYELLCPIEAE